MSRFAGNPLPERRKEGEDRAPIVPAGNTTSQSVDKDALDKLKIPAAASKIPEDFGVPHGTPIANKSTILSDIDRSLGQSKPPDLEYIYVEPLSFWRISGDSGVGTNPFGHASIRYTMPTGEQLVMNIGGTPGKEMVNFLTPEEFLFGTDSFDDGNAQRAIYNRTMIGFRMEDVAPEKIIALDKFYRELRELEHKGEAGYSLALSRVLNIAARVLPLPLVEMGNCGFWVSRGLTVAGFLSKPSYYPKNIFVQLLRRYGREESDNVNVVSYERPKHAHRSVGVDVDARGPVSPFQLFSSIAYWDLHSKKFVSAKVEVPPEGITARVVKPRY